MHFGSLIILSFDEMDREGLLFAKEGRPLGGMEKIYIISLLLPRNKVSCALGDEGIY